MATQIEYYMERKNRVFSQQADPALDPLTTLLTTYDYFSDRRSISLANYLIGYIYKSSKNARTEFDDRSLQWESLQEESHIDLLHASTYAENKSLSLHMDCSLYLNKQKKVDLVDTLLILKTNLPDLKAIFQKFKMDESNPQQDLNYLFNLIKLDIRSNDKRKSLTQHLGALLSFEKSFLPKETEELQWYADYMTCLDLYVPQQWDHQFIENIQQINRKFHHFINNLSSKYFDNLQMNPCWLMQEQNIPKLRNAQFIAGLEPTTDFVPISPVVPTPLPMTKISCPNLSCSAVYHQRTRSCVSCGTSLRAAFSELDFQYYVKELIEKKKKLSQGSTYHHPLFLAFPNEYDFTNIDTAIKRIEVIKKSSASAASAADELNDEHELASPFSSDKHIIHMALGSQLPNHLNLSFLLSYLKRKLLHNFDHNQKSNLIIILYFSPSIEAANVFEFLNTFYRYHNFVLFQNIILSLNPFNELLLDIEQLNRLDGKISSEVTKQSKKGLLVEFDLTSSWNNAQDVHTKTNKYLTLIQHILSKASFHCVYGDNNSDELCHSHELYLERSHSVIPALKSSSKNLLSLILKKSEKLSTRYRQTLWPEDDDNPNLIESKITQYNGIYPSPLRERMNAKLSKMASDHRKEKDEVHSFVKNSCKNILSEGNHITLKPLAEIYKNLSSIEYPNDIYSISISSLSIIPALRARGFFQSLRRSHQAMFPCSYEQFRYIDIHIKFEEKMDLKKLHELVLLLQTETQSISSSQPPLPPFRIVIDHTLFKLPYYTLVNKKPVLLQLDKVSNKERNLILFLSALDSKTAVKISFIDMLNYLPSGVYVSINSLENNSLATCAQAEISSDRVYSIEKYQQPLLNFYLTARGLSLHCSYDPSNPRKREMWSVMDLKEEPNLSIFRGSGLPDDISEQEEQQFGLFSTIEIQLARMEKIQELNLARFFASVVPPKPKLLKRRGGSSPNIESNGSSPSSREYSAQISARPLRRHSFSALSKTPIVEKEDIHERKTPET